MVREKATRELTQLGRKAGPALQMTLEGRPSLEMLRRVEKLLAALNKDRPGEPIAPLTGEPLRTVRAIRVLERIATPESVALLQTMSKGTPTARETREARAALERLTPAPKTTK